MVSYLPLSHIAAQIYDLWTGLQWGAQVCFAQPDALKVSVRSARVGVPVCVSPAVCARLCSWALRVPPSGSPQRRFRSLKGPDRKGNGVSPKGKSSQRRPSGLRHRGRASSE